MSKDFKVSLAVLMVVALFVGGVVAQNTLTDGATLTGDTIPNTQDLTVFQDQSTYPSFGNQHGTIVRWYSFDADGGALGDISLEKGNVVQTVPDNTIIVGGFIEVITPITPATSTNTLWLNADGDVLAEGTSLNTAGIVPLTLNGVASYSITNNLKLTNNMPLNLKVENLAATAGVFKVVFDVYAGQ